MKKLIYLFILSWLFVFSAFGESYFNPWVSIELKLSVLEGEKFSNVIDKLLESASRKYPLQFDLYLKKTNLIYASVGEFQLNSVDEKNERPLGIIFSELAEKSKIRFLVDPKSIIFVSADHLEFYDSFYLLPEKIRLLFKGKTAQEFFTKNGLKREEGLVFDVDTNYRMLRLRGDSASHDVLRKILEEYSE